MKLFTIGRFTALSAMISSYASGQTLYWVEGDTSKLRSAKVSTYVANDLANGLTAAYGIAVTTNAIYWTEPNANRIRYGLYGNTTLFTLMNMSADTSCPRGVAIDEAGNKIFWTDSRHGKVRSARLSDGANVHDVATGLGSPGFLTLDVNGHKLYWVDNGSTQKKIFRCDTSGATFEVVVKSLNQAWGIALDAARNKVYWLDAGAGKMQSANYSGALPASATDLATPVTFLDNVRGLAIDAANGKLYWSDVSDNFLHRVDTTGISQQTVVSVKYAQGMAVASNSIVLPVELSAFRAAASGLEVSLQWETQTETWNSGFDVEQKGIALITGSFPPEGSAWTKVGSVTGSGSSNTAHRYSFVERNVRAGRYSYRLKQIDVQGQSRYSNEVEVEVGIAPKEFTLSQNYPNPFNPKTTLEFTIPEDGHATLRVFDMLGREVAILAEGEFKAGYIQQASFDASQLASGVYIARLEFREKRLSMRMSLVK